MSRSLTVHPAPGLSGAVDVPGDKSVTHRAILLGALAGGPTEIQQPGPGADNLATLAAILARGVEARLADAEHMTVRGVGLGGLKPPQGPINCMNSGTTARLLTGLLAGAGISATLTGDASLVRRPMRRVAAPLNDLGYRVTVSDAGTMPIHIDGRAAPPPEASAVRVVLKTASAQVKSSVLLSGLYRLAVTEVVEPAVSRDHTERMIRAFGGRCESSPHYARPSADPSGPQAPWCRLVPGVPLAWRRIEVPGDLSSAAFLLAASALTGSGVTVRGVGTNPTRTAFLDVLGRMGARVGRTRRRMLSSGEPSADLSVVPASLSATRIAGSEIPSLIDEIPVLCVLGAASRGRFEVRDAAELRVKESDRIATTAALLEALGVEVETFEDGLAFEGLGGPGWGAFAIDSHGDHRIALAGAVAALAGGGAGTIGHAEAIGVSYPQFVETLRSLGATVEEHDGPGESG